MKKVKKEEEFEEKSGLEVRFTIHNKIHQNFIIESVFRPGSLCGVEMASGALDTAEIEEVVVTFTKENLETFPAVIYSVRLRSDPTFVLQAMPSDLLDFIDTIIKIKKQSK